MIHLLSTALAAFVVLAGTLWLSVFGYLGGLRALSALRRRLAAVPEAALPPLAVVVPTLDEEALIASKLRDLLRPTYPRDRLRLVVVDGGSSDRTCELVRQAMMPGSSLHLLRLDGVRDQAEQVRCALAGISEEFVVVTDADAMLDPGCLRALVTELIADPELAIAGAIVRPRTPLMEERLYGWMRNQLWWLEGEALSAATVSGACYGLRRSACQVTSEGARALDVRVAAAAAAAGRKVRLVPRARACEVRVPQSLREFTHYRRRRGAGYLAELVAGPPAAAAWRWRLARAVRLWHFRVVPRAAVAVLGLALALVAMGEWSWPIAVLAAFGAPPVLAVLWARPRRCLKTLAAGGRLVALTWFSLLALDRPAELPAALREAA